MRLILANSLNKKWLAYVACGRFFLGIIPACLLSILIFKFSVNVPFWDQWWFSEMYAKFSNDDLSFEYLISQANEHRLFFPRLIFLALAFLTHWDVRFEILVTFILACVISMNIYRLGKLARFHDNLRMALFLISNLLIFSPVQFENWLMGMQLALFIPIACITSCAVITLSDFNRKAKFLICVFLCTVSTFSLANGMISWVVVFPALALSKSKRWRDLIKEKWLIVGWTFGFVVNAAIYFNNYHKPHWHPSLKEAFLHPVNALQYFSAFLGAPLGFWNLRVATFVGVFMLFFWITLVVSLLRKSKSTNLHAAIIWTMIGVYALISGMLATFSRLGFGVSQALSSRYTSFSVYFVVSLVHLMVVFIKDASLKDHFFIKKKLKNGVAAFLTFTFIFLYSVTYYSSTIEMRYTRMSRLQGKACLLFANIVPEKECLEKTLYPDANLLINQANVVNSLGLLRPPLVESDKIRVIASDGEKDKDFGYFDMIKKVDDITFTASGWAILPYRNEPADAVILTYEKANGDELIFKLVYEKAQRLDVVKVYRKNAYFNSGWVKSFSIKEIPSEAVKLKAWAFDAETGKVFKLNGSHVISHADEQGIS